MAETDRQIRIAAETILSGSINSQRSSVTQYSVTRTPDIIISENLIAGARNNGRMSSVRRFFCLFVTFDLLFTILMWLICAMIGGETLHIAFIDQVVHYNIRKSLFDIVMAAICRFTVLLLFYALLYLNHWIIVAISTTTTCAFLLAKVFLFDWSTANQPVFQVLLILTSFVIAWAEAWFFDCRVIPQETEAARYWVQNFPPTERTPLLQPVMSESRQYSNIDHTNTFFTPMDSPDLSDDEDISKCQDNLRKLSKCSELLASFVKLTPDKIEEYKTKVSKMLQVSYNLLTSNEWKLETTTTNGDTISSMQFPNCSGIGVDGKIMKITGIIDAPANTLVDWLFETIEEHPSWNKLVTESMKLQNIDENTDIVYQATSPQGGGIIKARDFITLRHRNKCGDFYVSGGISVPGTIPSRQHVIRGENGVSCWATEELSNEHTDKCRFTWILNTDLKGWIPQKVVDKYSSTALIDFMVHLRKHVNNLQKPSI